MYFTKYKHHIIFNYFRFDLWYSAFRFNLPDWFTHIFLLILGIIFRTIKVDRKKLSKYFTINEQGPSLHNRSRPETFFRDPFKQSADLIHKYCFLFNSLLDTLVVYLYYIRQDQVHAEKTLYMFKSTNHNMCDHLIFILMFWVWVNIQLFCVLWVILVQNFNKVESSFC